jgi:hypothetical protein
VILKKSFNSTKERSGVFSIEVLEKEIRLTWEILFELKDTSSFIIYSKIKVLLNII